MKQIVKNYSFNAAAKTVTFTDFGSIRLDRVLLITNVTANTIIYQFNDPNLGGAAASNVLTLTFNTASMNNGDSLQVIYDAATGDPTYDSQAISGTVTANIGTTNGLALDATLTGGTQQTKLTDGTNVANVLKSDGTAAGQNAQLLAGAFKEVASLSAGSLNADLVASTDVANYRWFCLQITGTWSGTLTFQGSNDGSTWGSLMAYQLNAPTFLTSTVTANNIMHGALTTRFLRVRMTSYSSGTANGTLELYTVSPTNVQFVNAQLAGGTNSIGSATIQAVSGTALAADQTNSELRVSNYVKTTTAGDTPLTLGQTTMANSLPVALASDQSTFATKGSFTEQASLSAGSLNADLVPSTDVSAYKWMSIHIGTSAYSGTLTFQGSNDNSNFVSVQLMLSGSYNVNNMSTIASGTNQIFTGPVYFRYLRVRMTAYTSGTATGTLELCSNSPSSVGVSTSAAVQSGTWSVGANSATGSAVPANAFFVGMQNASGNLTSLVTAGQSGDGASNGPLATGFDIFNGTNWDRARSATSAAATTGTGLLGAGALGIFNSSPPTVVSGNYERLQLDSNANLKVNVAAGSIGASSATGSTVPANAFYQGGIAKTALPTAASDGNLTGNMMDKFGRSVVLPYGMRDIIFPITQLTLNATTSETTLIAATASTFNDLMSLVVVNTSATATQVDFRDSTAGTVRLTVYVPAGETRGVVLHSPMPQSAVNNNWTAKCGTSVTSVIITGQYIANK